jgi:ZIP family zinc transporter
MIEAALWGALAASSLLIGAMVALRLRPSNRITGLIMGFGSGTLISAIAYDLVLEAADAGEYLALGIAAGALTFFIGDWLIDRAGGENRKSIATGSEEGSGLAIFLGTLLDGIPESVVLGISLATGGAVGASFLIAVFISNLPEAIAATTSLQTAGRSQNQILRMWLALVAASAAAAALGYALVNNLPGVEGDFFQAFAAGAMLTMLADTMMPEAFEHGGKAVGLVTTLGFVLAFALTARG